MTLLSSAELDTLERLSLATRSRQAGFFAGDHRSRRFGSSVDFAEHREYRPGDDFRRIDAALSARMDRLYMKLYEAEEDVPTRIILDTSASMMLGTPQKSALAGRIAAAFVFLALVRHDRARLYAAGSGGMRASRWFRGRGSIHDAMRWITALPTGGTSGLSEALRAIREEGNPGLLVTVSDMLEPDWAQIARRLAPPGEAALVHLLAPDELDPSLEGDLTLVDAETGNEVTLAADAATLRAYRARVDAFIDGVRSACTARGIACASARSDEDLIALFQRAFRAQAVVR